MPFFPEYHFKYFKNYFEPAGTVTCPSVPPKRIRDLSPDPSSLRARLGIENKNYPMASRIIKDALEARVIKEENPDGGSRHNYIPYWA